MYAVIKTGGKQYKVAEGEFLKVEKLENVVGDTIEFGEVLMIGGEAVKVGAPFVAGAKVTAKVAVQGLDKKILVFKSKRRKNSR
jgi:large subunit ribosomal protein L21